MKFKTSILGLLIFSIVLMGGSSEKEPINEKNNSERLKINLRWKKANENDSWELTKLGFIWGLSFLGANIEKGAFEQAIDTLEPGIFTLDLQKVGFSKDAQKPLATILDSLKKTDEYQRMCGIELGRFLVLTLHTPAHYYKITGAEEKIKTFQRKYRFKENEKIFPVINSNIAFGQRIVHYVASDNPLEMAFMAKEGKGDIQTGTFHSEGTEVFSIMPNSQFRFAIYDENGNLAAASPPILGEAGKPGKCMWCHESSTQILREFTPEVQSYIAGNEFVSDMLKLQEKIATWRNQFNLGLHYANRSEHTNQELIYISFMEPSAQRLAKEWEMPIDAVYKRLEGLTTHRHDEFAYLGQLYNRKEVDERAPYKVSSVPTSVREFSDDEPDFFNQKRKCSIW